MQLEPKIVDVLTGVSTATITTILLKKGMRNVWIRGARPINSEQPRVVGQAFTLRFVPYREDLANPASWSSPTSTRAAVEAMPEGCIVVADAIGVADAGIVGDILCARMNVKGVKALVTDGAVRDVSGVRDSGLPVWASGVAAPPAVTALAFVGWQDTIGCGGVAVLPGDVIVADSDGAVVIPATFVEGVAELAEAQEQEEAWIFNEVKRGCGLAGLYPMSNEARIRYEATRLLVK